MNVLLSALLELLGEIEGLPRCLADPETAEDITLDADLELPEEAGTTQDGPPGQQEQPHRPVEPLPVPTNPFRYERPHASPGAFARTHFSLQAWEENVWRDYLTEPPILVPLGLAAAAGISHLWDKEIQKALKGSMGNRQWIGDASMSVLLAGSLATALFSPAEGRSSWDSFTETLEAFAVTAAFTFGLKAAFPRGRPGGSGDDSFPSGHTSAAFVGASLIDQNLDWYWGTTAYGLAALTGYSRIEADRHYLSDVLAGAAIGIFSAGIMEALHWGTGRGGKGIAGAKLELEYFDKGGSLGLAFKF